MSLEADVKRYEELIDMAVKGVQSLLVAHGGAFCSA
jgi:hypothetical protein